MKQRQPKVVPDVAHRRAIRDGERPGRRTVDGLVTMNTYPQHQ